MTKPLSSVAVRYGLAPVAVGLALILSLLMHAVIDPIPTVLFVAAIVGVAWFLGLGPALLTAMLSVVAMEMYLIDADATVLDPIGVIRTLLLLGVALLVATSSEARRRAERSARETGELFKVTLASIGDAVIATDETGTIAFINDVAASVTGWDRESAVGTPLTEVFRIVQEESHQPVQSPFERVLAEGNVIGLANHTLLIRRDGREVPIEDSGAPIREPGGSISGVVLVFRDATERRQHDREREEALGAEKEARSRSELAQRRFEYLASASEILSSSLDYEETLARAAQLVVPRLADWAAIDMLDADGTVRRLAVAHVNPEKVEYARRLQEKYPADPSDETGVYQVIRTGRSEFYPYIPDEMLVRAAHDEEHLRMIREIGFTSAMVVPIRVSDETVGAITLVTAESGRHFEQSDLALAEELARRASLAIESSRLYREIANQRDQLNAILRGASDGIIALEPGGRLIFANDAAATSAGYGSAEEMIAAPAFQASERFDIEDADGRPITPAQLPTRRAVFERQTVSETLRLTSKLDGQQRWVTMTASPVPATGEPVRFTIAIIHDVTRMKRSQEQLRRRVRQQEAIAALGERALVGTSVEDIIDVAVQTVADTLGVELVKVLEYFPGEDTLIVKGGVGWMPGVVGYARVPATSESQAGYTLRNRQTVIVDELATEDRFTGAPLLHEHDVHSGMTVRIGSGNTPFGILGAHSRQPRRFSADDAVFLETVANILASSISRRRTEHALEQQREWLRVTISSIGDAVIATDTEGRITFINPIARRLTGWYQDEAIGRPLPEVFRIVNEASGEPAQNPALRALAEGSVVGLANHTVLLSRDGALIPIDDSAAPIRDANGRTIGVVLVFHDVTEQRRADQSLRESEQRFRNLADSAPVQIWMSTREGSRAYFNRQWLEFAGRTAEEESGTGWLRRLHPQDRTAYLAELEVAGRERRLLRREIRMRRADGEYRWLLDTAIPRLTPGGEFAGLIGSCIDITDLKQSESELVDAKEQAESASAAKDQFLAVLSHELRTPLTPVLTLIQYLESTDTPPEDAQSIYEMIRRNIELEARLIDDLLDLTRITRGKLHLDIDIVDSHSLLKSAIEICREDISAKELKLSVSLEAESHTVAADPARLQQVFWNLVQNAVKFTPERGRIAITSSNPGAGRICFEIRDTGIGMEPDQLERVFNPFEQAERTISRRFGGLGLGLSISSSIVEMLGGTLTADSRGKDHGSTFRVTLATAEDTRRRTHLMTAAETGADDAPLRILLVDDHNDTSSVMKLLLERRGYRVTTESNVADALAALDRESFDLLISDIGLPDGSGLDLMRRVKERTTLAGIALSGFGMEEDIRRSRDAGFSEHLTKPVNFQVLQEAIRRVLG